jgi:uncharacterized protein with LGFP repeats/methionine-rich copper-binding protein CopC
VVTAAALLVAGLPAASAATALTFVSSTPADGSSVASAPTVSLTFSLPLDPANSAVTLSTTAGVAVPCNKAQSDPSTVACTPAVRLTEGPYSATAQVKDAASTATATKTISFTVDTTAPTPPTVSAPAITSRNVTAVPVSGSAENGASVEVTLTDGAGKTVTGSTRAGAAGYSLALDATSLRDGSVALSAVAVDAAGNRSVAGTSTTSKDTTGPGLVSTVPADGGSARPTDSAGAPTVISATYDAALTDASTLRLTDSTGNAVAGRTARSADTKTLQFTPSAVLAEGRYTADVLAVDADGNSTASHFRFDLDGTPPAAPTVTPPAPVSAATAAKAPVGGKAEPGSRVTVTIDDADGATAPVTAPVATAAGDGSWSLSADVRSLKDGTLTVVATATDRAGNTSKGSDLVTTVKDTVAPAAPTLTVTPNPVTQSSQTAVAAAGKAEPSSLVSVSIDDTDAATPAVTRTAQADSAGAWQITGIDVSGLRDGTLTTSATARDAVGNTGPASTATVRKDATPPGAPTLGDLPTITAANAKAFPVRGTAEPASTVAVTVTEAVNAGRKVAGTTVAQTDGSWSLTLDVSGLSDGPIRLTANATDADGNTGPSAARDLSKDTTPPAQPTLVTPAAVNTTNSAAAPFSGTTSPGALVRLSVDDTNASTAPVTATRTAANDGAWSASLDLRGLTDGTLTVSALAEDAVGNRSAATSAKVVKDTVAPAAPSVRSTPSTVTDAEQHDVQLSGSLATSDSPASPETWTVTVQVTDGTGTVGPVSVAPLTDRSWSVQRVDVSSLKDGTLTVSATVRDENGNVGPAGTASVTKDATVLALVSTRPAKDGAIKGGTAPVSATYNEPLATDLNGAPRSTIDLKNKLGNPVAGSRSFADGNRTIAFTPSADLTDAGSPYTMTVQAYDGVGEHITTVQSFTVDSVAPAAPSLVLPATVNAATAPAVPFSGKAEPASLVTLVITDGTQSQSANTVADSAGDFGGTISVTALADGVLRATAVATDAAGNASPAASGSTTKDTVAPTVSSLTVTGPVNAARAAAVPVSGGTTGGATAVTVKVSDGVTSVVASLTPTSSGDFSAALDLRPLADGPLTATATATDAAGNSSSTVTTSTSKDTKAPVISGLSVTDPITSANRTAVQVTGNTGEAGSSVVAAVSDTAGRSLQKTVTTPASGAFAAGFDLTGFAYGPVTVTVRASDPAGNATSATASANNLSPIDQKYAELRAAGLDLGAPQGAERDVPGGRARSFANGDIYWSAGSGAHVVLGAILSLYRQLGAASSGLGLPMTDELGARDGRGRYNTFQQGWVYWTASTGAHEIHGAIADTWFRLGGDRSALGYPTSNELGTPDGRGRYNTFERGSVYWTASTGAHEVRGAIRDTWVRLGAEGALGYPLTDELGTPDGRGRFNHFERGSVYWTPTTGAHEVHGAIRDYWASIGWERSWLGYPVSDEYGVPGGRANDFEFGRVRWDAGTGQVAASPG